MYTKVGHCRLLMSLCDGGFQYLLASCRSSVGIKSGRYYIEIKVVENLNPSEGVVLMHYQCNIATHRCPIQPASKMRV